MSKVTKWLTPSQYAKKVGKGENWIRKLCARGRIPGVTVVGEGDAERWLIPADAEYEVMRRGRKAK